MMESLICDAIIKHLIDNNLLVECQHGFIQGRSCVTQLLKIMDTWTEILDEGYDVDVAYLDYRKAFDSVPYERLLIRFEGYGVKNPILGWIRNFLIGRSQRVVINSAKSEWAPVTSGIPQGSVLRRVLFIFYVNDLPDIIHSSIQMFADDTIVFNKITCSCDCEELQRDIDSLVEWSVAWQLNFNTAKCKTMHIGGSNPHQICSMQDNSGSTYLKSIDEEKDLGVLFDPSLTFSRHCEIAANKANCKLGLIRSSFTYLDLDTLTALYKSLMRPHLEYCNTVWSPMYLKDSHLIESVQHRASKLIHGIKDLPYAERLSVLKLPSLKYKRLRNDMIQVYKYLHKEYNVVNDILVRDTSERTRGNSLKLVKQRFKKELGKTISHLE